MLEFIIGAGVGFFVGVIASCILLGKRAMKLKNTVENAAIDAKDGFVANYKMQMAAYDAKVAAEEAAEEEAARAKAEEMSE